ncbi:MAG: division/cell wall cluster transcriptional repressor MraZ, partial [Chloroflexi bacterium]|nr:division/cell wall cluster transcriptional repressor MraZ [Chloroflexota bacterium]
GASLQTPGFPAPKTLKLERAFFSKAFILKLDGQSRTALPPLLREYAGIKDTAVVLGVGGHIEIWDPERWRVVDSEAAEALEAKFREEAPPQEKE